MSIVDKNKALITELHAKAKRVGCKFRNKDLRRLKYAGAKGLGDMFSLTYGHNTALDEHGELVFSNPIMDLIPEGMGLLSKVLKDEDSGIFYQPVPFQRVVTFGELPDGE